MDDNLIPNINSFEIDQEAQREKNQEKANFQAAAPIMQDILDWFDKEIANAKTIDVINETNGIPIEVQLHAYKIVVQRLTAERDTLASLIDYYA